MSDVKSNVQQVMHNISGTPGNTIESESLDRLHQMSDEDFVMLFMGYIRPDGYMWSTLRLEAARRLLKLPWPERGGPFSLRPSPAPGRIAAGNGGG
jgi:transcriptional regulator GlxA family with amidase domain